MFMQAFVERDRAKGSPYFYKSAPQGQQEIDGTKLILTPSEISPSNSASGDSELEALVQNAFVVLENALDSASGGFADCLEQEIEEVKSLLSDSNVPLDTKKTALRQIVHIPHELGGIGVRDCNLQRVLFTLNAAKNNLSELILSINEQTLEECVNSFLLKKGVNARASEEQKVLLKQQIAHQLGLKKEEAKKSQSWFVSTQSILKPSDNDEFLHYAQLYCSPLNTIRRLNNELQRIVSEDKESSLCMKVTKATSINHTDPEGVKREKIKRWVAPFFVCSSHTHWESIFSSSFRGGNEHIEQMEHLFFKVVGNKAGERKVTVKDLDKVDFESLHAFRSFPMVIEAIRNTTNPAQLMTFLKRCIDSGYLSHIDSISNSELTEIIISQFSMTLKVEDFVDIISIVGRLDLLFYVLRALRYEPEYSECLVLYLQHFKKHARHLTSEQVKAFLKDCVIHQLLEVDDNNRGSVHRYIYDITRSPEITESLRSDTSWINVKGLVDIMLFTLKNGDEKFAQNLLDIAYKIEPENEMLLAHIISVRIELLSSSEIPNELARLCEIGILPFKSPASYKEFRESLRITWNGIKKSELVDSVSKQPKVTAVLAGCMSERRHLEHRNDEDFNTSIADTLVKIGEVSLIPQWHSKHGKK
ncbi:hypothetical protein JQC92_15555 [Shewanella sp. 202IG2-18]|uniref:hypothetical protein n=1 Tax=Parashewanella hymeniacidonis TaxID=2807618 RepID=UPI00195FF5A6|nr:hypothetical protein [Parashewanella hymeniacidonis]MBM7073429.1 hypothetical protein [Parashewanella hymeniacidonis]